jgi:electron transfer flavoprotein alpha subunit
VAAWVQRVGIDVLVLPASPDGRDLAPVLAHLLQRPLLDGAVRVGDDGGTCTRWGGRTRDDVTVDGPFVATLQPGVRGLPPTDDTAPSPAVRVADLAPDDTTPAARVLAVLPPDVGTMDLAEAPRIVGGGAGLDAPERFEQLGAVARALGASMGGTRVVTDRGWIGHERQIGTTGVAVDPEVYLAFGISGAVQHTAGLGDPAHVVSVNLDPHCPMMQRADLAIVADANEVVDALARKLGVPKAPAR